MVVTPPPVVSTVTAVTPLVPLLLIPPLNVVPPAPEPLTVRVTGVVELASVTPFVNVSTLDELLAQLWLPLRSTVTALVVVPPIVSAPEPEAMIMPPVPIARMLAAVPPAIPVVAVFETVIAEIEVVPPSRFAVDAVVPAKFAVSAARGGVSVPVQLPDADQTPVVVFQVEVDCACTD